MFLALVALRHLVVPRNIGKQFRVFDFKRRRELEYVEGRHLTEVSRFEHELLDELKYLVDP